jgi:trk system potassium uptake protein TrkA
MRVAIAGAGAVGRSIAAELIDGRHQVMRMLAAMVEEAVSVGDLVRLMTFRQSNANLVELTLPAETPLAGKPVSELTLPRDAALVTILRGDRVIVPQPEDPLEPGDELLFVATADVEPEIRTALGY